MIDAKHFYQLLKDRGVSFFAGVPDSLLSSLCALLDDECAKTEHVIAANEGNAVALAAGFHLSSGKVGAVYMQNSGLGNAINPLASLTDPAVYRIPMLLIIGWRGEPGVKDEPQHVKQGQITEGQLDLLGIPYWHLDSDSDVDTALAGAFEKMRNTGAPVAFLVRKGAFSQYNKQKKSNPLSLMRREQAIHGILEHVGMSDLLVSTTGKTSRELYECREKRGEKQRDFLTVGSMGHTSSIALGVAFGNPSKRVYCLDGDGSLLMHMGALPIIGSIKPANFVHVVFNNAAHESVGGQPTVAGQVDFAKLSAACGYPRYEKADSLDTLAAVMKAVANQSGPIFVEVLVDIFSRDDLSRPKSTPEQNKASFIEAAHG